MSWANNDTDVLMTYLARRFYDRNILRKESISTINSWNEHRFYGRINPVGETILVDESLLLQIRSDDDTVRALSFVADAFQEFQTYYSRGINRGLLTKNSLIASIRPKRAWTNPRKLYSEHLIEIFEAFNVIFLDEPKYGNKIKNFVDYVDCFMLYFKEVGREYPVTLTSFIPSPFCSPHVTGLTVEVATQAYDDDEGKFDFVNDPNFKFYQNTVARFGFLIDKNIPWRLTANLSSVKMIRFAEKVTPMNISAFFFKTHLIDMNVIFEFLINYYNAFVNENSRIYKIKNINCSPTSGTATTKTGIKVATIRRPIKQSRYDSFYGTRFSLRFYFKIRLIEAGLSPDAATVASHTRRILGLYGNDLVDADGRPRFNDPGMMRALNYIQDYVSRTAGAAHAAEQAAKSATKVKLTIPSNVEITPDFAKDSVGEDEDLSDFPLPRGATEVTFGG